MSSSSAPAHLQNLQAALKVFRPEQIEDLWRKSSHSSINFSVHQQAEAMEWWATKQEVSDLLDDSDRLRKMVQELNTKTLRIGMFGKEYDPTLSQNHSIFVQPGCLGCNSPYDNAGSCRHEGSPSTCVMMNPEVNDLAHDTLVMLSVMNYLVADELLLKTNKLSLLLNPTQNQPGINVVLQEDVNLIPPITLILALMDNCSRSFPKIAHQAAGLLSLLICGSPAAAFSCIDGKAFVHSISHYLEEIFRLVHNTDCIVEEYYGVVGYLNILPALYHFGNWNEAKSSPMFNIFLGLFVSLTINICHGATFHVNPNDDDPSVDLIHDEGRNLEDLPELLGAKVLMETLLLVKDEDHASTTGQPKDWRIQFLHRRPRTFAVMAGLEVLGWWMAKGIDLSLGEMEVCDDDYPISIKTCILEYESRIKLLIKGSGKCQELSSYIVPILDAIIQDKKKAPLPKPQVSLLYGPFIDDNRRCGLCQKSADEVQHDLLRCGGGCGGLQHYCCRDHQRQHWKQHKFFCKHNAKYSQYTGT